MANESDHSVHRSNERDGGITLSERPEPLPNDIIAEILSHLPLTSLPTCMRINSTWHRLALPLLYRRITISGEPELEWQEDCRHSTHRSRQNRRGLPLDWPLFHKSRRLELYPLSFVRDLTIPAFLPSTLTLPKFDNLDTLRIVIGWLSPDQMQITRHPVVRLSARTLVIAAAPVLYNRLEPRLVQGSFGRVVMRCEPDRAVVGTNYKYEPASFGANGILRFMETFDESVPLVIVFDSPPGGIWRPSPRPGVTGPGVQGSWLGRLVTGLAEGMGQREIVLVNASSTDPVRNGGSMDELRALATRPSVLFMDMLEWAVAWGCEDEVDDWM